MNLPVVAADKANHALYGAVIAAMVSPFNLWWALIAVVAVGIGKEVSDWWQNTRNGGNHGIEIADAVATVCGGLLVLAPQLAKGLK